MARCIQGPDLRRRSQLEDVAFHRLGLFSGAKIVKLPTVKAMAFYAAGVAKEYD